LAVHVCRNDACEATATAEREGHRGRRAGCVWLPEQMRDLSSPQQERASLRHVPTIALNAKAGIHSKWLWMSWVFGQQQHQAPIAGRGALGRPPSKCHCKPHYFWSAEGLSLFL